MFSKSCVWFGKGSIAAKFDRVSGQCVLNSAGIERDFKQGKRLKGPSQQFTLFHFTDSVIPKLEYGSNCILNLWNAQLREVNCFGPWSHLADLISEALNMNDEKQQQHTWNNKNEHAVYLVLRTTPTFYSGDRAAFYTVTTLVAVWSGYGAKPVTSCLA